MIDTKAYLYTLRDDGTINVHEGTVSKRLHNWQRTIRFTPDEGTWCFVSSDPFDLYYRKVWMPERDDDHAKRLFIEYHERKVKECEKNLEMHKHAVAMLKGENYEHVNLG